MIFRLAYRNLTRNRWRSILTAGGVAFAVMLMVWFMGFMEGFFEEMIRSATSVSTGQVLVQTEDYADEPTIHEAFEYKRETIDELEATEGVVAASPRVNLYGLIGNEKRSQVASLRGVVPELEGRATSVPDGIVKGRWLTSEPEPPPAPRDVVLGEGLFQQLDVELGDELVVFLEASDGSLGNDLLRIVGVVETGNSTVDRMGAYIHLDDAQYIGALDGRVHEVAIKAENTDRVDDVADRVEPVFDGLEAESRIDPRTWKEVVPQLGQMIEISDFSYLFMYLIIYLIAALGIINTQRMSALERRREFGVMMAIGVTPRRLFWTIVVETIVLAGGGTLVGGLLGTGLTYLHAVHGIDMKWFGASTEFSWMGVSFSGQLHTKLTTEVVLEPLLVMMVIAMLAGFWPAVQAVRTNITEAISGRG